jgi:multidrug efflux pump subunit AcrB
MLPPVTVSDEQDSPYDKGLFRVFKGFLSAAIKLRWVSVVIAIAILGSSIVAFGQVKQLFFPDSSMTKFMIDYWAPEGTRIETIAKDLEAAEEHIGKTAGVKSVASFLGAGPPRFYLPVSPEKPYPSYGQLIVEVDDYKNIPTLMAKFEDWFEQNRPQAIAQVRPFGVGPSETWKLVVRVVGPADATGDDLRKVAGEISRRVGENANSGFVRTDWRQRSQLLIPKFNQDQGLWTGITKEDVANATKRAFDGIRIGFYREEDDLIPILLRREEADRNNVGNLELIGVRSPLSGKSIPLVQLVDGIETVWEDPLIWRRDRKRTIEVQSNPIIGVTMPSLYAELVAGISEIELPPGYSIEWGGEIESSGDAQASLIPGIIPALAIIVFIIVALFNAYRPALVILLTIPFVMIGISYGLLAFDTPFGFVALLGAMSLCGMMIKNAIVLIDEIDINIGLGKSRYDSIMDGALSRLRPVLLAAGTTVLGVIPLLQDVFWIGLAVTVMAGLSVGTVLTMVLLPVLYSILYGVKEEPVAV